jgi:hypothetical protein
VVNTVRLFSSRYLDVILADLLEVGVMFGAY